MPTPQSSANARATTDFEAPLFAIPGRSGPGRPTLCTPQAVAKMCGHIRENGISDSAAGYLAGVTSSSLSRWKQQYEEVEIALGQARALFEGDCIRKISDARKRDGTEDWRALAWLVRHSSPEGYGPKSRRRKAEELEEHTGQCEIGAVDDQTTAREAMLEAMNVELVAAFTKRQAQESMARDLAEESAVLPEIRKPVARPPSETGEPTESPFQPEFSLEKNRAILPEIHQDAPAEGLLIRPTTALDDCLRGLKCAPGADAHTSPQPPNLTRQERRRLERLRAKEAKQARLS